MLLNVDAHMKNQIALLPEIRTTSEKATTENSESYTVIKLDVTWQGKSGQEPGAGKPRFRVDDRACAQRERCVIE